MIILVVYILFSVFVGAVVGIALQSVLAGVLTAILWPIGLAISIYELLRQKLS